MSEEEDDVEQVEGGEDEEQEVSVCNGFQFSSSKYAVLIGSSRTDGRVSLDGGGSRRLSIFAV